MEQAVREWIQVYSTDSDEQRDFVKRLTRSYVIYGCMVLLPNNPYLNSPETSSRHLPELYELIAKRLKITHVAVSKPIPPLAHDELAENVLRAPSNFLPLYGDFGPGTCNDPPTQEDFNRAFWVTAKQNGIFQTWAPRWTMFSRGNISEKARLLTLLSVSDAIEQGASDGRGFAAVDLYAGIGYFAFSYLKAGVKKVLAWDLNPWSLEGLMRGAKANKWKAVACVNEDTSSRGASEDDVRLLVFNESNQFAASRIEALRPTLPPIRHVNCGFLPSSKTSWPIALRALDPAMGGWIHVHENFAIDEISQKAEAVRQTFDQLLNADTRPRIPVLECVNRLKSYAPGVMHCVLDIHIPSRLCSD